MSMMIMPGYSSELRIGVLNETKFRVVLQQDPRITAINSYSINSVKRLRVLPEEMETMCSVFLFRKSITMKSLKGFLRTPSVQRNVIKHFIPPTPKPDNAWEVMTRPVGRELLIEIILGHRPLVEQVMQTLGEDASVAADPVMLVRQKALRTFIVSG